MQRERSALILGGVGGVSHRWRVWEIQWAEVKVVGRCSNGCDKFHLPKWYCSDGEVHQRLEMSLFLDSQVMNGN